MTDKALQERLDRLFVRMDTWEARHSLVERLALATARWLSKSEIGQPDAVAFDALEDALAAFDAPAAEPTPGTVAHLLAQEAAGIPAQPCPAPDVHIAVSPEPVAQTKSQVCRWPDCKCDGWSWSAKDIRRAPFGEDGK